jgi:DNA-binding PucR family transcriptional regulator
VDSTAVACSRGGHRPGLHDYNANQTARQLYVHANTLAYRLRIIRRLLGGDPARGDLRLTVELALKLNDLPRLSG